MLGYPDAYHLPSDPGAGFLKADTTDVLIRFKASYVSAALPGADERRVRLAGGRRRRPVGRDGTPGASDLAAAVGRVSLGGVVAAGEGGRRAGRPENRAAAPPFQPLRSVPFAVVDEPFHHRRGVLALDLSGTEGHVLVVGGPQSGKSTAMHDAHRVARAHPQAHRRAVLLPGLRRRKAGSPGRAAHVGGVTSRLAADRVRRTVADVARVLAEREEFFHVHGVDSISTYRRRSGSGEWPDQPWADVFLVIDGWATLRNDFEALEPVISDIAARGLGLRGAPADQRGPLRRGPRGDARSVCSARSNCASATPWTPRSTGGRRCTSRWESPAAVCPAPSCTSGPPCRG